VLVSLEHLTNMNEIKYNCISIANNLNIILSSDKYSEISAYNQFVKISYREKYPATDVIYSI